MIRRTLANKVRAPELFSYIPAGVRLRDHAHHRPAVALGARGELLDRAPRPYHRNFGKRLIRSPKLRFLDTGRRELVRNAGAPAALVYGGDRPIRREDVAVYPWFVL